MDSILWTPLHVRDRLLTPARYRYCTFLVCVWQVLYDGFEPSGRMHIAQGSFKAMNVNKCTAAGGTFIFWVADWFALMNDKMGGARIDIHMLFVTSSPFWLSF